MNILLNLSGGECSVCCVSETFEYKQFVLNIFFVLEKQYFLREYCFEMWLLYEFVASSFALQLLN